ncbi:MAG: hypothetical protein KF822_05675 [Steroidobacteraceae bacterium]|nr:hypothetical protein [Steroidobacteraceae bacterium]
MPAVERASLRVRIGRQAAVLAALWLAGSQALAGGPLLVRSNGVPFAWGTGTINYRTDNGPLSPTVPEATAQARVIAMFDVWQGVPTSYISFSRVGFINSTGAFTDGDVSTLAEYDAVDADCAAGNQSPVVYDADGSIVAGLGMDNTSVIGFASPCTSNATNYLTGLIVMNGRFQDGLPSPGDIPEPAFDAAIIHEIGHFSGLDHSQINVNCMNPCGTDDLAGVPTMFPFLVSSTQASLSVDDMAWISRLHPRTSGGPTFAGTYGTLSGVVFFSDGQSHAQFVNVIARPVGIPQNRTSPVSVISGYRFRAIHGNPITGDTPSQFGSTAPGDIGLFEIPVPAGSYTIEVESVHPDFTDGSSIGPYQIAMPGTAPPPSVPVSVAAGATSSGNNVTLIGTPPRFDQFEGP